MNYIFILIMYTFFLHSLHNNDQERLNLLQKECLENPTSQEAWTKLGIFLLQHNYIQESFDAHKKALEINQNNLNTWFHIANCYLSNEEPEIAQKIYESILKQSHFQSIVWHNLGYALKKQNKGNEALKAFEYALRYALEDAGNHLSYALMLLGLGNYQKGFEEYEWRWCTALKKITFNDIPLWNGESLAEKTLLVTAEQGFGDSFQFMRYLKLLHDQGVSIIFRAQSPVMPLAQLCPYIKQVIHKEDTPSCHIDAHIPLMSIPYIMQTTIDTIPKEGPYLFTHPEQDMYWEEKLSLYQNFKIGICFKGNDHFATANFQTTLAKKSLPTELLKELINIPNTTWFCLHKSTDINLEKEDISLIFFDDSFDVTHGSFIDTASIMKGLDLVITVDTATAHLAGALYIPTIVLLPFVADWRWLINRTDSPWYPTLYLLRQKSLNDWNSIILPLKINIQKLMKQKGFDYVV